MKSWALAIPICWAKQKLTLGAMSWTVCKRMCGETFLGKKTTCKGLKGQEKGKQKEALRVLCLCAEVGAGEE
jgi:hypothetical protein